MAMFSTIMLFLGLIGEQLRIVGERTRNVPLVLESERINFSAARSHPRDRAAPLP